MDFRRHIIKYFVNPFVWRYVKGSKRFEILKELRKKQWKTIEENKKEQQKKLYKIIKYAHRNVPYYRRIINKKKISYTEEKIFEDIKKFPVLTKKELRENFDEIRAEKFNGKYSKNTSGGSTGEPAVFLQDLDFYDYGAAVKLLYNEWAGNKEGEYFIKLWGSERDILEGGEGIKGFIVRNLMNVEMLNTFRMSKEDMNMYIKKINNGKPSIIEAYAQSIYELAKYIEKNNLRVYNTKGIITSAGVLYPEMRKKIESVFKTRIYNRYGSREVGDIACSCEKNEELHVAMSHVFVEILNEKNEAVKPGKTGGIYITSLTNKVMPLIRYKIGDLGTATLKGSACSCGRGLERIKDVKGREVNIFINTKGDLIDGEYFTHLMYFREKVERFQFIQKKKDLILLKVSPLNSLTTEDKKEITSKVKKVMGTNCVLKIEEKKEIHLLKSGKHLYTVSEVRK